MDAVAVVLESPGCIDLRRVSLAAPADGDIVVEIAWSGISTGTEKLLFTGRMPQFPGMGYPLVPGYESVGVVTACGKSAGIEVGTTVFVPGANCFDGVRGLFGGAASRVVLPAARVLPVASALRDKGVLLALAATAYHAVHLVNPPDLIIGFGTLGRLIARLARIAGADPVVWERDPARRGGVAIDPAGDTRRDYAVICDASGDSAIIDSLVARLRPGGTIVLAGFYAERLEFSFPPAFMREARIAIAAQWQPRDLAAVGDLVASNTLELDGLITHHSAAADAASAYETAFGDPTCLKMVLNWSGVA